MLISVWFFFCLYLLCFNHTKVSTDDSLYLLSSSDPVEHSVSAETKNFTASEEIPTPVESEEPSDTKQAVENVSTHASPAESTPSLESEIVDAAPAESAPAEVAPAEVAPVEAAPVESVPSSEEPPAPKVAYEPSGTRNILSHHVNIAEN